MEVLLERPSEGVVLLRINRPEALNARNSAVREQLAGCFTDLAQGEKIRCVVITGSDKVFVAGAD